MNVAITVSRWYVVVVALSGFLFGQLLFGHFSGPQTAAGVFGALAAGISWIPTQRKPQFEALTVLCCILALIGVGLDARYYYLHLNGPGNYYAWFMIGPFILALVVIAFGAGAQLRTLLPVRP